MKHGLWEEGKRIEWFDEEAVDKIKKGELDYKVYYKNSISATAVKITSPFKEPSDFESKLDAMKKIMKYQE
jgi:hypothetical protein